MCLLYWPLQNAIYQFCQHSSKLLRIQSMDFYIVSKDGVCAQIHLVCILILIFFFPCQVRIFKLLSSLEVNFLGYLQIPPVLQFSCHRSIQLVLIILQVLFATGPHPCSQWKEHTNLIFSILPHFFRFFIFVL